jgi:hypothetical protein
MHSPLGEASGSHGTERVRAGVAAARGPVGVDASIDRSGGGVNGRGGAGRSVSWRPVAGRREPSRAVAGPSLLTEAVERRMSAVVRWRHCQCRFNDE